MTWLWHHTCMQPHNIFVDHMIVSCFTNAQSWDKLNNSIKEVTALFKTITSHWRSKIHYLMHSLMPFTLLACDSNSPSASPWKLKITPYCRFKINLQVRAFWRMYFASVTPNPGFPVIVNEEMMQVQVQIYSRCEIFTLLHIVKLFNSVKHLHVIIFCTEILWHVLENKNHFHVSKCSCSSMHAPYL